MSELIKREDAINAVEMFFKDAYIEDADVHCTDMVYEINHIPTASPWHRVEEKPKEGTWCVIAKHSYLQPHNLFYDIAHYLHGTFSVYDCGFGEWFDGKPLYWMPIEPPKEE